MSRMFSNTVLSKETVKMICDVFDLDKAKLLTDDQNKAKKIHKKKPKKADKSKPSKSGKKSVEGTQRKCQNIEKNKKKPRVKKFSNSHLPSNKTIRETYRSSDPEMSRKKICNRGYTSSNNGDWKDRDPGRM